MDKIIAWLFRDKSSDPLIRYAKFTVVIFAIAGTIVFWAAGKLASLIYVAMIVFAFTLLLFYFDEMTKRSEPYMLIFGRFLTAILLIVIVTIFVATGSYFITGKPESIGRLLGQPIGSTKQSVANPLRFQYQVISHPAAWYAATKGMGYSEENGFEKGALWWKNDVLQNASMTLNSIGVYPENINTISNDIFEAVAFSEKGVVQNIERYSQDDPTVKVNGKAKKFFGLPKNPLWAEVVPNVDMFFLLEKVKNDPQWTLMTYSEDDVIKHGTTKFDGFVIFGLPKSEEIVQNITNPMIKSFLEKNESFRDIVFYEAFFAHDYSGLLIYRQYNLLVLSVENISDVPVSIKNLKGKRFIPSEEYKLLGKEDQLKAFLSMPNQSFNLPIDSLKPGERLFIPLSTSLGLPKVFQPYSGNYPVKAGEKGKSTIRIGPLDEFFLQKKQSWSKLNSDYFNVQVATSFDNQSLLPPPIREISVEKTVLESKSAIKTLIEKEYYFGPIFQIDGITLFDDREQIIPIRFYDPTNVLMTDGTEKGSCPILYIKENQDLIRLKPILVNAKNKSLRRTDAINVPFNISSFVLAEEEAETTYIEEVSLHVIMNNGALIKYNAPNAIQASPKKPITLTYGQSIALNFSTSHKVDEEKERLLIVSGYYIPKEPK